MIKCRLKHLFKKKVQLIYIYIYIYRKTSLDLIEFMKCRSLREFPDYMWGETKTIFKK